MTETSTAATISTPEDFKIGTIGKPFPGCEVRIADDGEILVKGPNVFQGYYKNEEATRGDDRRRLAPHRRHRRDRRRRLHQDHRPQEGHHHHRGRQEHHPRQPRDRDQAAPAGLPVRRRRRPPALPGRAGHPRPRRGGRLRQGARPARGPRAAGRQPRGQEGDRGPRRARSTRSSPASSRSRRSRSSPSDLSQEGGELTPTLKVKRAVVATSTSRRSRSSTRAERGWRGGVGCTHPCANPLASLAHKFAPDGHPTPLPAALAARVKLLARLVGSEPRRRGAARPVPWSWPSARRS